MAMTAGSSGPALKFRINRTLIQEVGPVREDLAAQGRIAPIWIEGEKSAEAVPLPCRWEVASSIMHADHEFGWLTVLRFVQSNRKLHGRRSLQPIAGRELEPPEGKQAGAKI
jgi:hypothetical protein